MDLRKESTTTILLGQHNSLLCSKSYSYMHREGKLPPAIKEASLYRKGRQGRQRLTECGSRRDQCVCRSAPLYLWLREYYTRQAGTILTARGPGPLL